MARTWISKYCDVLYLLPFIAGESRQFFAAFESDTINHRTRRSFADYLVTRMSWLGQCR